ncbi:serine hydrolase domain-containing protein [Pontibacter ramchanderi]|uniref:CubicO group peptidase (Beta-lactamase class C family) n=1 Tax=Pontibacter ramchanderi TaxID=1179743 RepID=A0A2N3UA73_9BACT|nr:serine hydrolase [Pontibacter ramchanderi]PKV63640.1 CubicO group peptidase (beta-lactamase class C family) [Pontibacter ramchanderi]
MNRKTKRFGVGFILVIGLAAAWLQMADKNYVYRALYHNFADIDDNLIFHQRKIAASDQPQPWPLATNYNQISLPKGLQQLHEQLESVAFVIIHRDSLLYEQYWDGYSEESLSNSFSVAKSIVSMLVGVALHEGAIKSIDQPVGDFLPELREGTKAKITLRHLLWMSSGLNWDESYGNPFSVTTEAYYGSDLKKVIRRLEAVEEPGQAFSYKSGDTQILAFVLEAATGKRLADYAEEKLWRPLGAERKAEWSIDHPLGNEKAYCCFFSNARDFARIGQLYLQNGVWKGDTLVAPEYVQASLTPSSLPDADTGKPTSHYGYQWWLLPDYKGQSVFYARGILGQYVIVIPEKELVVVRLGKKRGERTDGHPSEVKAMIDAVNQMVH